jgi:hypothetical protein
MRYKQIWFKSVKNEGNDIWETKYIFPLYFAFNFMDTIETSYLAVYLHAPQTVGV